MWELLNAKCSNVILNWGGEWERGRGGRGMGGKRERKKERGGPPMSKVRWRQCPLASSGRQRGTVARVPSTSIGPTWFIFFPVHIGATANSVWLPIQLWSKFFKYCVLWHSYCKCKCCLLCVFRIRPIPVCRLKLFLCSFVAHHTKSSRRHWVCVVYMLLPRIYFSLKSNGWIQI